MALWRYGDVTVNNHQSAYCSLSLNVPAR